MQTFWLNLECSIIPLWRQDKINAICFLFHFCFCFVSFPSTALCQLTAASHSWNYILKGNPMNSSPEQKQSTARMSYAALFSASRSYWYPGNAPFIYLLLIILVFLCSAFYILFLYFVFIYALFSGDPLYYGYIYYVMVISTALCFCFLAYFVRINLVVTAVSFWNFTSCPFNFWVLFYSFFFICIIY